MNVTEKVAREMAKGWRPANIANRNQINAIDGQKLELTVCLRGPVGWWQTLHLGKKAENTMVPIAGGSPWSNSEMSEVVMLLCPSPLQPVMAASLNIPFGLKLEEHRPTLQGLVSFCLLLAPHPLHALRTVCSDDCFLPCLPWFHASALIWEPFVWARSLLVSQQPQAGRVEPEQPVGLSDHLLQEVSCVGGQLGDT